MGWFLFAFNTQEQDIRLNHRQVCLLSYSQEMAGNISGGYYTANVGEFELSLEHSRTNI